MEIRSFVAVELSGEIKEKLRSLSSRLQKGASFFPVRPSWVNSDNIHITLKFLGNVDESRIGEIKESMNLIAARAAPFTLSAAGLGVFPNRRQPRILWVGITEGKDILVALQKEIERKFEGLGFEREQRPFHPHLTIARLKYLKGTAALLQVADQHQPLSELGEWHVTEMVLFKSVLKPDGAVYTPLHKALFTGS